MLLALSLIGCARSDDPVFLRTADDIYGLRSFPPGTRVGMLFLYLENRSEFDITIQEVIPRGSGLGESVRIEEMKAPPNRGGSGSVPSGAYVTDPPVFYSTEEGACHVGSFSRLKGFVLEPRGQMRVWMILELGRPGDFEVTDFTVRYRSDGRAGEQTMPQGFEGSVRVDARESRPDRIERPCLGITSLL
ncbi:MAG: hypothetical protein ACRDHC_06115 [Actinomycetota bacterium]